MRVGPSRSTTPSVHLRTVKEYVPTSCGYCRRKILHRFFLYGIARKLVIGQTIEVEWHTEFDGINTWTGTVKRTNPAMIAYKGQKGVWPFPPADNIHVLRLKIQPLPATSPHKVPVAQAISKYAQHGGICSLRFRRYDTTRSVTAVVTKVMGNRCIINLDGKLFHLPPPAAARISIQHIYFLPPPAPVADPTYSEAQRQRRYRRLQLVFTQPVGGATGAHVIATFERETPEQPSPAEVDGTRTRQVILRTLQRKNGVIMASWNVCGVADPSRVQAICAFMFHRGIWALALQETRRNVRSKEVQLEGGWGFYETAAEASNAGAAIILSKTANELIVGSPEVIAQARCIAVNLGSVYVVSAYLPTLIEPELRDATFDALAAWIATKPANKPIYILGDFNARPRAQIRKNQTQLIEAASQFEDFQQRTNMRIAKLAGKDGMKTHRNSTLDYIVARARFIGSIENLATVAPPLRSDHLMLLGRVRIKWAKTLHHTTANPPIRPAEGSKLANIIEQQTTHSSTWDDFLRSFDAKLDTMHEEVRTKHPKRSITWQSDLAACLGRMEAKLRRDDVVAVSLIDAIRTHDNNRLVDLYAHHVRNDPRRAWSHINALRDSPGKTMPAKDPSDRLDRLHAHFAKLFAPPVTATEPRRVFEPISPPLVFDTGPFTEEEVQEALGRASDSRAPGADGITNETLKLKALFPLVLRTVNSMLNEVTQQQRTTIIVPLPKKGDLAVAANWRGIALMPHITKLFDTLLLMRLRNIIDPHLHPAQNGFRPDRGTTHHVMALRAVLDIGHRKKDYPVAGCFVDFAKAFDSVRWWAIEQALRCWGVPDPLVKAVFNVMQGHTVAVRTSDGLVGDKIAVNVGVLQGDTLAPFLFVLIMDGILRKLPEDAGLLVSRPKAALSKRQAELHESNEKRLIGLAYADDIVLLAHGTRDLQRLFTALETTAAGVGLMINMGKGKTERFVIRCDPGTLTNQQGEEIPIVPSYKYLGVYVLNFDNDLAMRTGKAWGALKTLLQSATTPQVKRTLFFALIEPIFSYGLAGWALTCTQLNRIDNKVSRMLRYALGLAPAFISRDTHHTEDIYGEYPFISAQILGRRIHMISHHLRAQNREHHPYIRTHRWKQK